MDEPKHTAQMHVEVAEAPPLAPPLHVGFVEVIQVGDDLQLTLCDVDTKSLFRQVAEWKQAGSMGQLNLNVRATPMQRIYLSKLALPPLVQALHVAAANLLGVDSEEEGSAH